MKSISIILQIGDLETGEEIFNRIRAIGGQDCIAIANMEVDEQLDLYDGLSVIRPE